MSKALDIADAIAAHLNDTAEMAGAVTLVDRQKDILAEVNAHLEKLTGAALSVLYSGFSKSDRRGSGLPVVIRRYAVRVWALPVLQDDAAPRADDFLEAMATALQNWEPDESTGIDEINVTGADLVPDTQYLVYEADIEVISRL